MSMGRSAFCRLAATHTLIPVTREVLADLETPVSAFWKLRRGAWSFLLESVEGGERWARYTTMGTEPRAIYRVLDGELEVTHADGRVEHLSSDDPLRTITSRFEGEHVFQDPALPRFIGGLVGAVPYDAVRSMERLPSVHAPLDDVPELVFMETALVLVWDNLKHRAMLVYLARVPTPGDADAAWDEAQRALDAAEGRLRGPLPPLPVAARAADATTEVTASASDGAFSEAVEQAREFIAAGDIIQVVLSRRFSVPQADLHPFLVYRALRQLNPSPYMFFLEMGDTTLAGASPEVLVRATAGLVETRPIAGTRPRGRTPEQDAALADELLADPKERAEHVMLVDLGRNDIGRVAQVGTVEIADLMIIERYSHVMHLVSHVRGELRHQTPIAEVLRAVFPAGTLSGAPKVRAMQLVEELEGSRRGYYGGAVGMIGAGGDVDLCITIRTLVAHGDRFDVQAGAGIVYDSIPEREAEETRSKARAVLRAIELARERFAAAEVAR